jgi:4-amino-4-deoxy-L-arabinose transferase-like glycosyltransferase
MHVARASKTQWSLKSLAIITAAWLLLQMGSLFSPGLMDDADAIHINIAREMLHRHDFVSPYLNGLRFFEKPPMMFWLSSGSMAVFGETDWAARLPLALTALLLCFAVYALGTHLFGERGGFYSGLALATCIGPYLYTRFYIPDILIPLWMTLGVYLFLIALDRLRAQRAPDLSARPSANSALLPCLGFAVVLALNLLTKGLIGLVFPIGFVLLYLAISGQLRALRRLHPLASAAVFLIVAAPWHILAALRNPPIPLPAGIGLPARGGWAWTYIINEHFARFLGKRIPHDYGNTPVWLFWLYLAIWIMPWTAFLPGAIAEHARNLGHRFTVTLRQREAALSLVLWTVLVVGFFTVSHRQEYYSLPAIPALTLMAGGLLARAEGVSSEARDRARTSALRWAFWLLVPLTTLIAVVCGFFAITAPRPAPGADLNSLLTANPDLYNLSMGHLFDLTGASMGLFRAPLIGVALSMLAAGLGSYLLRRAGKTYAANLTLAASMILVLLCAHEGLRRFYPILGSKDLALAINQVRQPGDMIVLDGEFASGSSLAFYTNQQVHLVNGRENALWYGSFWPDAPQNFETENSLHTLWASPQRIFFFTYNTAARTKDLAPFHTVHALASSGGKTILTNR